MTEKENHLPNLSSEERAHALELAIQARRRYAALKARVKSGELTFTDAMDEECPFAYQDAIGRNLCQVFKEIDFVYADDGNPRWRHLGFLVSGQAGNPAEKARERVRRHPLFHAFSALALIEYQCSPAKAALRVARFGKWVLKVH